METRGQRVVNVQFSAYRGAWADVLGRHMMHSGRNMPNSFVSVQCSAVSVTSRSSSKNTSEVHVKSTQENLNAEEACYQEIFVFVFLKKKRKRVQYHSFSISIIDVQGRITGLNRSTACICDVNS